MKKLLFSFCAVLAIFGCGGDDGDLPCFHCEDVFPSSSSYGSLPYGGRTYKTVRIGTQTWMAENLNYNASGSKCYSNQESNCTKYGRLYDWATALTVCPSGWHLPSQTEWNNLSSYVQNNSGCSNCDARLLKATSGWNKGGNGTDDYGFSALPGGYGSSDGYFGYAGDIGNWWSSSEFFNSGYACSRDMCNDIRGDYLADSKSYLFSVRCVKD